MPIAISTRLRAGMVGMGMIFDETYRPFFEQAHAAGVYDPRFGVVRGRTGRRRQPHRQPGRGVSQGGRRPDRAVRQLSASPTRSASCCKHGVDFVCVATPDDRHFAAAKAALEAGKHVLIEKPSVLSLAELDELDAPRPRRRACSPRSSITSCSTPTTRSSARSSPTASCKHVNNGYCTLLEPKSISGGQFAEWITGRNPGHVRRRPLHQADRLHVRRPAEERRLHRPARASSARPTARPGTRRSCG